MTSLLHKKRRTTPPNILRLTSTEGSKRCLTPFLLWFAFGSATVHAESEQLQWRRATAPRSTVIQRATFPVAARPARVVRDASVVAAVWEEDDAFVAQTQATDDRSVVVKRPGDRVAPGAESFAERPDDPFEEPTDDPRNDLDIEDPPIEEAQKAIDQEFDLRQIAQQPSEEDLFEIAPEESNSTTESPDLIDEGTTEVQPEQSFVDPFDEPMAEPLPEPKATESPLEEDGALEQDTDRRQMERDLFGDSLPGENPLDSPDVSDLFDEEMDVEESDESMLFDEEVSKPKVDVETGSDDEAAANKKDSKESDALREAREESEKNCAEELEKLKSDRIDDIDLSIRVEGNAGEDFPFECSLGTEQLQPRRWPQITYTWKAAALCHKPLYFEQVQLERYGHSWGPYVQPIMSGAHFFGTIPILPYKMGLKTPTECVYTLGSYRPGSCAPYMIDAMPITWRAILFEAGAATGISFTIP